MSEISSLLLDAINRRASDLHLRALCAPRFRIHGDLTQPAPETAPITAEAIRAFHKQIRPTTDFNDDDFGFEAHGRDWRANTSLTRTGPRLVVRLIPDQVPDIASLGLPAIYLTILSQLQGFHLVTGPTGSGKTTTLAAIIRFLAKRSINIVELSDPIEMRPPEDSKADVVQRELTSHFKSYRSAIRSALRQDPDVLVLGELRDRATVRAALTAAETGHMVFATLHNATAKDAVDRLLEVCKDDEKKEHRALVASQLQTCIAMQLVKTRDGGRAAACELLVRTHPIANLIRDGQSQRISDELNRGNKDGQQPMNQALVSLARSGRVARSVARDHSPSPHEFDILFPQ